MEQGYVVQQAQGSQWADVPERIVFPTEQHAKQAAIEAYGDMDGLRVRTVEEAPDCVCHRCSLVPSAADWAELTRNL